MDKINEITLLFATYGAAITQAQAARLLNRTTARIAQQIKENKLETIDCLGVKMVTLRSIIKIVSPSFPRRPCSATASKN